ncbi:Calx-beta domain-containing protein [Povalibacter sp.]|uniref:Calx-beta domain-containing protein n=1 Tax=Povalibacter sp. TaxID=1962978 RepID=UPI002F42CE6E
MHTRADQFGADLRHFLYFQRSGIAYCGQAYLVGSSGVSGLQCGAGTFAHEAGHNFGAHHDRANATGNVNLPINAYNYGFVCGGAGTLMSSVGTPRLSHYSDPALSRDGAPCGIAEGQSGAAHNGRAIEVMRPQIEAFRTPAATYGSVRLVQNTVAVPESDTGVDITIARDGDLTRVVSVEVATLDGSAEEQADYQPILTRLEFAANEASKTVRVAPVNDEDFEQDETFRIVLRYPLGLVVAGSPITVTLTSDDLDRGKAEVGTDSVSVWENGGPVTVMMNRTGTTTQPLTVSYATVDGTAVAGAQYEAVSGQVTFAPGATSASVAVRILDNDRYEQPNYRSFAFAWSGANLGQRRTQWIHVFNDDPNRGRSQFAAVAMEVPENAGAANLTIQRIEGSESTLFVEYATADGTAVAGRDYVAAAGSFTFQPGEVQRVIPVQLLDNSRFDGRRVLTMNLGGQSPGPVTTTTIAIVNDDPDRGLAEFAQSAQEVAETAGTVLIPVRRTGATTEALTVFYATESGSAESPRDFQHTTGQVIFAPGVTAATIPVTIVDNIHFSANRTFTVRLSGDLTGSQVASSVTILNDDPNRGRAQFESGNVSVAEAIGNAVFTVTRIDGSESSLVVNYATTDGTARAGVDYQAASGVLTFAAGETVRTITVPVTNNTTVDAARTFSVVLHGDFLGTTTTLAVTITNDDSAPPPSAGGGGGGGGGGSCSGYVLLGLGILVSRRRLRRGSQNLSLLTDVRCQ